MKKVLLILFLFSSFCVFSQQDFKGLVVDAKTGEVIPYVNIGIIDKGVGTVSDEQGIFHLPLDISEFEEADTVQISCLGYETIRIPVSKIEFQYNEYPKLLLNPVEINLDEVVVTNTDLVPIKEYIGYQNNGSSSVGYWKDNVALGGELATKIKTSKGPRQLNSLEFEVWSNPSDSILIRINVYDSDGPLGRPLTNLNKSGKDILKTLTKGRGFNDVDLEPYNIYVNDDFYISLELLKVYGDSEINLVLAASDSDFGSYRKYTSQDKWQKVSDINMAYYLETSPYVSQEKAKRYEAKVEKARRKLRMLSGFAIYNGSMVEGVIVKNQRTRETTKTDNTGRYVIHADKKDIIMFSKEGYKKMVLEVNDQKFANALMKLVD